MLFSERNSQFQWQTTNTGKQLYFTDSSGGCPVTASALFNTRTREDEDFHLSKCLPVPMFSQGSYMSMITNRFQFPLDLTSSYFNLH